MRESLKAVLSDAWYLLYLLTKPEGLPQTTNVQMLKLQNTLVIALIHWGKLIKSSSLGGVPRWNLACTLH